MGVFAISTTAQSSKRAAYDRDIARVLVIYGLSDSGKLHDLVTIVDNLD